jgi:hypothetical protein
MRNKRAVDVWVQVISATVGVVLVLLVLGALILSGAIPALDALSLATGVGIGVLVALTAVLIVWRLKQKR